MSRIAELIGLRYPPVAIYRTPSVPDGAFVSGNSRCAILPTFLMASKKGRRCAIDKDRLGCHGAISGYGFGGVQNIDKVAMKASVIPEDMRDTIGHGGSGKREFRTPYIAKLHMSVVQDYGDGSDAIVFEPLDDAIGRGAPVEIVTVLVNGFELSALSTLAGYSRDNPGPGTIMPYGHACQQIYAIPRMEGDSDDPRAVVGMTDLYVRKFLDPGDLSFSAPTRLWRMMEENAESSFLTTGRWKRIRDGRD